MARHIKRKSDYAELRRRAVGNRTTQQENVIPMINIIFLLLLYFMIAGNLQPDYDVTPPVASNESEPPKQIPTVAVTRDGKLRFENRPVTLDNLKVELTKFTGHERLKIHADAKVDALTISQIMKTASEAGVMQFVLVTQRRGDAP